MRMMVLFALLVSPPVWAKTRNQVQAERLMTEAKKLSNAGDHLGAIETYREAYERSPEPRLLLQIAAEQKLAGLEIQSIEVYERYLKHPRASKAQKRKVHLFLADLYARLSSLRIEVDEPAIVSVDGKLVGEGMLVATTQVLAGEHTILAQRDGFRDTTLKVTVEGGVETVAQVKMLALREAETVAPIARSATPSPAASTASTSASSRDIEVVAGHSADRAPVLSLSLRGEADVRSSAAGPSAGLSAALGRSFEVEALALIQRATGLRLGGVLLLRPGRALRPLGRLGVTAFFDDGSTSAGIHVAGGLLWQAFSRVGLVADLAVEHYPDAPGEIRSTAVLLSFGARAGVL